VADFAGENLDLALVAALGRRRKMFPAVRRWRFGMCRWRSPCRSCDLKRWSAAISRRAVAFSRARLNLSGTEQWIANGLPSWQTVAKAWSLFTDHAWLQRATRNPCRRTGTETLTASAQPICQSNVKWSLELARQWNRPCPCASASGTARRWWNHKGSSEGHRRKVSCAPSPSLNSVSRCAGQPDPPRNRWTSSSSQRSAVSSNYSPRHLERYTRPLASRWPAVYRWLRGESSGQRKISILSNFRGNLVV